MIFTLLCIKEFVKNFPFVNKNNPNSTEAPTNKAYKENTEKDTTEGLKEGPEKNENT